MALSAAARLSGEVAVASGKYGTRKELFAGDTNFAVTLQLEGGGTPSINPILFSHRLTGQRNSLFAERRSSHRFFRSATMTRSQAGFAWSASCGSSMSLRSRAWTPGCFGCRCSRCGSAVTRPRARTSGWSWGRPRWSGTCSSAQASLIDHSWLLWPSFTTRGGITVERQGDMYETPNNSVETNRRPAFPLVAEGEFGSTSYVPPSLSAAVAHLWY